MLTPVFKSDDPGFNTRAAELASKLVMSMDDDTAREFTTQVVADILWDDIEKNERTLQRHLNTVVSKRLERVEKAAGRIVSKAAGGFSDTLEEISKATRNPYDWGYVFEESDFNRDPGTGRFRAKVRYTSTKPVKDKIARATPNLPNPKKTEHLSAKQKAEYQQGYQQVANFLDTIQQSGMAGDSKIYATVQERGANGRTYVTEVSGTSVPKIDPETERFVGIEARPTSMRVGGASFGLVSALGGGTHRAGQAGATAQAVDDNMRTFADDWTSAGTGDQFSSNARLYGRVEAGSRFLGQVAPAGSKLQIASAFGEFIGRQGPQAERVLGPRARTTMYRYRGTEKTPDAELTAPYNRARTGGYSFDNLTPENQTKVRQLQRNAVTRYKNSHGGKITPDEAEQVRQVVLRRAFNVSREDAAKGAEAGKTRAFQAAQSYLMEKVPKGRLYDLQLKSGHTPPSEGIIIDKSGKIVTQAIGYGDDHYLPFNLKNLKGLRGGEYIRTRSVGGPTTEDIYTGLVSGARRVTVVSRSGTFTITFDDTFRGTRRYNDKAGRMVGRYGKILDAIKSEQVERQPLDPEVRGQIANDVEMEMGSFATPREIRREIGRREAEYKENPTLTRGDEERIEARVRQVGGDERTRDQVRAQLRNEVLESKAYNFRLNGDGYAAAIKALEEQFPYYLTSDFRPTREGRYEGAMDRGYVKPRYNRPQGALEGYYDTSVNGEGTFSDAQGNRTGKNTADRVDYQNSRGRLSRVDPTPVAAKEEPKLAEQAAEGLKQGTPVPQVPTPAEVAADRIESAQARQSLADVAAGLQLSLSTKVSPENRGPMAEVLAMDEPTFRTWYSSPSNQETFRRMVDTVVKPVMGEAGLKAQVTAFDAAHGLVGGEKFTRANHMMTVPTQPYSFDGAPYMRGGNIQKKQQELARVAHRTQVPGFGSLADMTHDDDFKEALGTAHKLRVVADQVGQQPQETRASFLRALIQNDPNVASMSDDEKRLLMNPEKVDQMVEDVNRAWALRQRIGAPAAQAVAGGTLTPAQREPVRLGGTPQRPAAQTVNRPSDMRGVSHDYSKALIKYASLVEDPAVAETLTDLANDFDIAAYSGNSEEYETALRDFNILMEDMPEHKQAINGAVMNQMRERYK